MAEAELPSDAFFLIFLRLPVKSLARFRCVCKLWCKYIDDPYLATTYNKLAMEEPMLLMYKGVSHKMPLIQIINFSQIKYAKQSFAMRLFSSLNVLSNKAHIALKVKRDPILESRGYRPAIDMVLGSCNGLLLLGSIQDFDHWMKNLVVVHPLRKELCELPLIDFVQGSIHYKFQVKSCGLGFDTFTNTFKVVCVALREDEIWPPIPILNKRKTLRTMVHVLGTNMWREIPQVPYHCWTEVGVFVHGWLHWLGDDSLTAKVIFFDVKSEEFGFIDLPKQLGDIGSLVKLCGELGFVCDNLGVKNTEVWVLKNKEWVMHCRFQNEPPVSRSWMFVVGCLNKDGDILLTNGKGRLFVYNLKSDTLQKAGRIDGNVTYIQMYRGSLFSIHGAYFIKH